MNPRLRLFACLLLTPFLLSCRQSALNITGDGSAVGARIEIDGKDSGVMEARTYSGNSSDWMKSGQTYAAAQVRLPAGPHDIKIIAKDGKSLSTSLEVAGEAYLGVDFQKGILQK